VKRHKATAPPPDPTAQAIHDLQAALQQAVDQLRGLQQTISSDHAETKRLSDQVNALSGKLEALQQSISRLLQFSQQSPQGRSATAR
jgi:septal ring factor EnvC (AmiA/AmiB activator)